MTHMENAGLECTHFADLHCELLMVLDVCNSACLHGKGKEERVLGLKELMYII